jgi:hypothetical protein
MQPAAQVDDTLGTLKACGVVCKPLEKSIEPVVCAHELLEWLDKTYKRVGVRAKEGVPFRRGTYSGGSTPRSNLYSSPKVAKDD